MQDIGAVPWSEYRYKVLSKDPSTDDTGTFKRNIFLTIAIKVSVLDLSHINICEDKKKTGMYDPCLFFVFISTLS